MSLKVDKNQKKPNKLIISYCSFQGRRVVAEFSAMAGLGGMGLGILAWCHQQLRYEKEKINWPESI